MTGAGGRGEVVVVVELSDVLAKMGLSMYVPPEEPPPVYPPEVVALDVVPSVDMVRAKT